MRKVLLIVLDGFGEGKEYPGNALTLAKTPTIAALREKYPPAFLKASGAAVGIPEGTQGGSEVGHFTIGAGRIVFQQLEEINRAINDGSFFEKPGLIEACDKLRRVPHEAHAAKAKDGKLHLLGMISDQGVHSDINHLFALLELAKKRGVTSVKIHCITDGRDVPEHSAKKFIAMIEQKISSLGMQETAKIATIMGRYYAMDRDENWKRIEPAYNLLTLLEGSRAPSALEAIENAYKEGTETDYYIPPTVLDDDAAVTDKDSVIFWNFRSDRARELTWCFTGEPNPKTGKPVDFSLKKTVRPHLVCFGPYSEVAPVIFPTPRVIHNLGAVISQAGLRQLRLAETQKYAHVTYFLNSQIEEPFRGEDRIMIDSKKCHSYAEIPEMSAREITDILLQKLDEGAYDFIAVNFANLDLVGHSGNLQATIQAAEALDASLARIVPAAKKAGYVLIITGDHGNAEYKIYEDTGEECPSHTTNPVPLILADGPLTSKNGELRDIAPTILSLLGIPKPKEMTGESLIL